MIGYMAANWGTKFIVIIVQFLCTPIFALIQLFCSTFMNLATLEISSGFVEDMMNRIYIVVGIYMLFKFCFSLFTAIISPDKLTDKEKGFGKMVQRTIVSLIMLIMVPIVFGKALGWQTKLALMVPRLIVGSEVTNATESNTIGAQLASDALKPFISINEECVEAGGDKSSLEDGLNNAGNLNETINLSLQECPADKSIFAYEFSGIVATVVGVILVVILASYCIEIAIRVIKLGILRVIAPIPIISYIDPKSEKGGSFSNWLKECISTYIDLFIKLAIFYLVLEILGSISSESVSFFENSEKLKNPLVNLFIILGAFFFMGKASDFICNILGIKSQKGGGILGKTLAGVGGILAGAGLGAGAALITGGGLAGAAAAALEGAATGIGGKPMGAFNKGRDIATQFKSGGKETKYKPVHRRMQDNLRSREAAKSLFGTSNVAEAQKMIDDAKMAMLKDEQSFDEASRLFAAGRPFDFDGKHYETPEDMAEFNEKLNSLKSTAAKSQSKYSDLKEAAQYAGFAGLNMSSIDKGKDAVGYFAKNESYRAIRNSRQNGSSAPNVSQAPSVSNTSNQVAQNIVNGTSDVHVARTDVVPEMVSNMINHIENPRPNNSASQTANAGSDMVSNMTRHIQNTNNNANNSGNNSNK